MKTFVSSFLLVLVGNMVGPLLLSTQEPLAGKNEKPVIVVAERSHSQLQFKIDSKPTTDLLLSLSKLEKQRGPECPVVVFVDSALPIEELWNIDGIAAKAEFSNVRFFVRFRETGKMSEILRSPAIPFSLDLTKE